MTLACEDANSKLVEVVTVDDVYAEKRGGRYVSDGDHVGNSLVQIWKLKLGQKA